MLEFLGQVNRYILVIFQAIIYHGSKYDTFYKPTGMCETGNLMQWFTCRNYRGMSTKKRWIQDASN